MIELGDLAVNERTQSLLQFTVVPLEFPMVLLLVRSNQSLVLPQSILASAIVDSCGESVRDKERVSVCVSQSFHLFMKSLKQRRSLL